jgi:hypothetical protein
MLEALLESLRSNGSIICAGQRLGFHLFLEEDFRFLVDDRFRGTFPPARRASDKPIAIACLRLVTFLPDRPLFSVPRFRSCIAFLTFCDAFLPYFAMSPPCSRWSADASPAWSDHASVMPAIMRVEN